MTEEFRTIEYSDEVKNKLEEFYKENDSSLTYELVEVLLNISETGLLCYEWPLIRKVLSYQIMKTINRSAEGNEIQNDKQIEERKITINNGLNVFSKSPFTVQRLCEIALNGDSIYQNTRKLLNAIERLLKVNTVIDMLDPDEYNNQVYLQQELVQVYKDKEREEDLRRARIDANKKKQRDALLYMSDDDYDKVDNNNNNNNDNDESDVNDLINDLRSDEEHIPDDNIESAPEEDKENQNENQNENNDELKDENNISNNDENDNDDQNDEKVLEEKSE